MNRCFKCDCDLTAILDELNKMQSDEDEIEYIKYCPQCGQMLVQDCPKCQTPVKDGPSAASCPNPQCKCELIFCEKCGKINTSSDFNCKYCNTITKTLNNIFLGNLAGYGRTNVYLPQKDTFSQSELPKWFIGADFSKCGIRSGVIYFWRKHSDTGVRLCWRDISHAAANGNWGNENLGEYCDIKLEDISDVEIFNQYILTVTNRKLLINSADDGRLIKNINVQDLLNEKNGEIFYKAAVINDTLIISAATHKIQKIFSINVNPENQREDDNSKEIRSDSLEYFVSVETNPAIINGTCAYFAGYNGKVYKISFQEGSGELKQEEFTLKLPAQKRFSAVNQLAAMNENSLYMLCQTDTESHLLLSNKGSPFVYINSTQRAVTDKISFYNGKFYLFEKDQKGKPRFSCFGMDTISNPKKIFDDYNATRSIHNYYITAVKDVLYLIYMHSTEIPLVLTVHSRAITGENKSSNKLMQFFICDKTEFLIYENYIIGCDHSSEKNGYSISVKTWL